MNSTLPETTEQSHPLFDRMARVRPINYETDYKKLVELADADGHVVVAPTHVVTKGNEIVGYLSLGVVPTVLTWMSTEKVNSRDSIGVLNLVENLMAAQGYKAICLPCWDQSPFSSYMEKFGYTKVFTTTIYIKPI